MDWFWNLLGYVKALSFVSKFGSLLSFIPGVGPIASALGYLWQALTAIVKYVCMAIWQCVLHPVTLIVVAMAWGFGTICGMNWDAHLVDVANGNLRQYVNAAQGAVNVEKGKAEAAIEQRDRAEQQAKANLAANPPSKPNCSEPVTPSKPVPGRVRSFRAPRSGDSLYTIPGLPGL